MFLPFFAYALWPRAATGEGARRWLGLCVLTLPWAHARVIGVVPLG